MSNRLAHAQSPYLLQHKDNPVDWYPWGTEAFETAQADDKPIFLSIGYSTCHWCHVMAHESFEDEAVAARLNDVFVPIKVDREERPDVDQLYMTVCQMMRGQGGWPLTVLLTPERKPFYAATYLPKRGRLGQMGLLDLIDRVEQLWAQQRDRLLDEAGQVTEMLEQAAGPAPGEAVLDPSVLEGAYDQLADRFDAAHGGFGGAPKFPSPHNLMFLLRYAHRTGAAHAWEMVEATLRAMQRGGIFDHVGGGFHRYSTDAQWKLPHFEKMLYDQALLALVYTEAHQALGVPRFEAAARATLDYVLRQLRDPAGGFYSAEDADSEAEDGTMEEGAFYVWSVDEVRNVLDGPLADLVIDTYNLQPDGNYADEATRQKTGKNVLYRTASLDALAEQHSMASEALREQLATAQDKLRARRAERPQPGLDDKVLTDWNGLMMAALAKAAAAFDEPRYATAATATAAFLLETMRDDDGRLLHRYRRGDAAIRAHLDDYAALTWGLIELYEATFETRWLGAALDLTEEMIDYFWDAERGGFYLTADDGEPLLVRAKALSDGAQPSGNAMALYNLVRLARLTNRPAWEEHAEAMLALMNDPVREQPAHFTGLLLGVDFALGPTREVILAGASEAKDTKEMIQKLHRTFAPDTIVLLRPTDRDEPPIARYAPFTAHYAARDGRAAAYVCRNYQCDAPTTDPDVLQRALKPAERNPT